jgi:hypothetical protein
MNKEGFFCGVVGLGFTTFATYALVYDLSLRVQTRDIIPYNTGRLEISMKEQDSSSFRVRNDFEIAMTGFAGACIALFGYGSYRVMRNSLQHRYLCE